MITIFLLGSESDRAHAETIAKELGTFGIPYEMYIASAHKVPEKVLSIVYKHNKSMEVVYMTIAGKSNALSGMVAANSVHPVIACPPFADKDDYLVNIHSTLQMPSGTPVLTVIDPKNAAQCVARIFGLGYKDIQKKIQKGQREIKRKFRRDTL